MRMIDLITRAQDCSGWKRWDVEVNNTGVPFIQLDLGDYSDLIRKSDKAKKELEMLVKKVHESRFIPGITKVIFDKNNETTVIIWADGEKTVVRNTSGAPADRYAGFCAAVCKRLFGSTTNTIKELDEHDVNLIAQKKKAQREALDVKSKEILAAWKEKAAKEKRRAFDKMVDEEVLRERARRKAINILNREAQKTDDRK